jgi:hypothetical protein
MAGKIRSPNYPALSLPIALEAADKLWKAEKRTSVSNEAAALALGFKSLSGPARVAIATMRQYGLIDKAEKGHLQLSDLAMSALHGDANQKGHALAEAAVNPSLFGELAKTHLEASENAIRSHLLTKKGFAEDGARKAAKAFRETITSARTSDSGYTSTREQEKPQDMNGSDTGQDVNASAVAGGKVPDGVFSLNVPFSKGTIAVQVRVTGDAISPAHLARVRKYLELAEQEWDGGQ